MAEPQADQVEVLTNPPTRIDPVILSANTLGHDLLAALLQELRQQPDHWLRMPEEKQKQTIERLREKVQGMVTQALSIMLQGQYPHVQATVASVLFSGGIRAVLKIGKGELHRHEFADREGQAVMVVMANPAQYLERMGEVKAKADQLTLFDEDYDPAKDQPMYRRDTDNTTLTGKSWAQLRAELQNGEISKEEAEQAFGGPLPETPPADDAEAPLLFGSDLTAAQSREAEISMLIERLFAIRVTISKGALYALTPAELHATQVWLEAYLQAGDSTPQVPCPIARPLWIPRPDDGASET